MLVLAISAILVTIAVPMLQVFQCRSRSTEARSVLKALYTASMVYFNDHNTFPQYMQQIDVDYLAIRPPPDQRFADGRYYMFELFNPFVRLTIAYAHGYDPRHGIFVVSHNLDNPSDDRNGRVVQHMYGCN